MTFERPDLLTWLPVVVVLLTAGILWQWRRASRLASAYGGRDASRRLTGRTLDRLPAARLGCALVAAVAMTLAASGVRRGTGEPEPPSSPLDLIVALDVSHSMTATDVEPSRFSVGRGAVTDVVHARVADRVALTLFAGWPYGLVPVTDDTDLVDYFLPWVEPELVEQRQQGTALADVIRHAVEGWRARAREGAIPVLLVVSDGEVHGTRPEVLTAAATAAEAGLRIWTAGVGTEEGARLLVSGSRSAPLLGGSGGQVVAGYDADLLREIADVGGGAFRELEAPGDADALVADLRALGGGAGSAPREPFDPTVVLLLVALALLASDAVLDSGALARGRRSPTVAGRDT